jgi:hypothetical protein
MCRVVRVTKLTGSSLDDWIYWHFGCNIFRRVRWIRNPLNEDDFLNSTIILSFIEE